MNNKSEQALAAIAVEEGEATPDYYGGTITVKGRDLITSLMAGETIEFTRIVVGSGRMPKGVEPIDMEDLVEPVAKASSTVPTVENGEMSLVVEYRNDMNGGLAAGFWLREFGIYAKTANSEEILLYYATLGNSPQPVNAYKDNRIDIRRYPVSIALELDATVEVTYNPGAFLLAEDAEKRIASMMSEQMRGFSCVLTLDITIPAQGWESGEGDAGEPSGPRLDIPNEAIREDMVPMLTILPAWEETAQKCGLRSAARTLDGALRVYAQAAPDAEMRASLMLASQSGSVNAGGGSGYVLPAATKTRLGGVKIGPGVGVEQDGTIRVDVAEVAASDESTREVLDGVFGSEQDGH